MSEQEAQQPVFSIEKIYVKDLSLEVPHAPQIFLQSESPAIEVQVHSRIGRLEEDGVYEVVLTVTVTAKVADKTLFLAEAAQAGIFHIRNVPEADLEPVLGINCPNILFPYVREVISDVVGRAGFPQMYLSPVNFEALYVQQKQAQQQPAQQDLEIDQ